MNASWQVGSIRVTKVVEHEFVVPFDEFLLGATPEAVSRTTWLAPRYVTGDGSARTSIHGLVIDTGSQRILVDTCIGHLREAGGMPPMPSAFPEALGAAGYGLNDIDAVVCTHLHFDHVGWNTHLVDGRWEVSFPNARYLFARAEFAHWQTATSEMVELADTVRPVMDAGLLDLVEVDHVVCAGVRLEPTPGHTPGHVSVHIENAGENLVITGDIAHHPVQFAQPSVSSLADSDADMAERTRRRFLAERAADGALVVGTHFAGTSAGHVVSDGAAWRFAD